MSYTKTTWQTGDVVTAEKLNNLENGVANSGSLIIHTTRTVDAEMNVITTMDKTYSEIETAMASGQTAFVVVDDNETGEVTHWFVCNIGDGSVKTITFNSSVSSSMLVYEVADPNDYPINVQGGK